MNVSVPTKGIYMSNKRIHVFQDAKVAHHKLSEDTRKTRIKRRKENLGTIPNTIIILVTLTVTRWRYQ